MLIKIKPLLFFITLPLSCESFSPFYRSPPNPSELHLPTPDESPAAGLTSLVSSLTKAFPSDTHNHPAYSSVFTLLNSLESAPSCQRAATNRFITDCNSIGTHDPKYGNVKIQYAAQLAVCEFEATGIRFPPECKVVEGKEERLRRCVKKLEERPQWWTTLSNNIQNAVVICAAVRHEVEKDQLLDLHRNITKVQQQLFEAMDVSRNQVWEAHLEQKKATSGWMGFLAEVNGQMESLRGVVGDAVGWVSGELRSAVLDVLGDIEEERKGNIALLERLDDVMQKNLNGAHSLGTKIQDSWTGIETSFVEYALLQKRQYEDSVEYIKKGQAEISANTNAAIRGLKDTMTDISTRTDGLSTAFDEVSTQLASHHNVLAAILETHSELIAGSSTLHELLVDQILIGRELVDSISEAGPKLDHVITTAFAHVERLTESIDEAEVRIQKLEPPALRNGLVSVGIPVLLLLATNESWRKVVGYAALALGIFGIWDPDLMRLMRLMSLVKLPRAQNWVRGTEELTTDTYGSSNLDVLQGDGGLRTSRSWFKTYGARVPGSVLCLGALACVSLGLVFGVVLSWYERRHAKPVTELEKDAV